MPPFLLLIACLALASCGAGREAQELTGATMGTRWHVTYLATEQAPPREQVQAGIERSLEAVNASMSTYREDSEISRFNRHPVGEWFAVSPAFARVLSAALAVGELSGSAYDVTVAPLVDRWGFGPDPRPDQLPPREEILALLERVGQQKLALDSAGGRVRKEAPVQLDFSSIAKGFAVDQVAEFLHGHQVHDFMVEVGGEIRLAGRSPRGDLWRIAVEKPDPGGRAVATTVSLSDSGMATSGDYRNFFELDGIRYSHTIDPRTGYPVQHDLVSVTVITASAMLADAWATALTVLGGDQGMAVAEAQGLAVYFIRRRGGEFVPEYSRAYEPYANPAQQREQ